LIVGGYAVAFHGAPRLTGDIYIYVRPSRENAERLLNTLCAFGFGEVGLEVDDFAVPGKVVQLGVPPVRIDFVTSVSGVSCEEAFSKAVPGTYGGVPANFLSRDCLMANKRACGRKKDLADLEALGAE
jgi:hypothetical protein